MFSFSITPYPGLTHKDIVPYLNDGERMKKPDICPDKVYEIMSKCWEYNPDDRPDFEELVATFTMYIEDEVIPEVRIHLRL